MDGIRITTKPDIFRQRGTIDRRINERMAKELQNRLQATTGPSVDTRTGLTRRVRSAKEGNRLIIDTRTDDRVAPTAAGIREAPVAGDGRSAIPDLFSPSSGIPTVDKDGRLIFRSVDETAASGMREMEESASISLSADQVLSLEYGRYLEESIRDIISENPEIAFAEEQVK
jgi:hypothetical protein